MRLPRGLFFLACLTFSVSALADAFRVERLQVSTFGRPPQSPVILIHGGPGKNSRLFELSLAPRLVSEGYYVVTYDQRGQGRSEEAGLNDFNYTRSVEDLKLLIDRLKLSRPVIIAQGLGGAVAIRFEQRYPDVARKIVLISAPLNFRRAIENTQINCQLRQKLSPRVGLGARLDSLYRQLFEGLDTALPEESARVLEEIFSKVRNDCNLERPTRPNVEAAQFYEKYFNDPLMTSPSFQVTWGFLLNEEFVDFNESTFVFGNRARFCGIYGSEDGFFLEEDWPYLRNIFGREASRERFHLINDASHNVYVDRPAEFMRAMRDSCGL